MTKKKLLCVPFAAVGVCLLAGATAWACTTFKGSFHVTGNRADSGTVVVAGKTGGMNQCVDNGVARADRGANGSANEGFITIAVGTSAVGTCASSTLPNNTYTIRYYNSVPLVPGYSGTGTARTWKTDCMSSLFGKPMNSANNGSGTSTTTVSGGVITGPTQFWFNSATALNASSQPNESAVCITDSNANYGNQAPLTTV